MPFEKGHKKLGGVQKGYKAPIKGRTKAIALLDKIFGKEANLRKLERVLQDLFDSDTIQFLGTYGIALAPKEQGGNSDAGGVEQTPAEICADMDKATIGDKPDA